MDFFKNLKFEKICWSYFSVFIKNTRIISFKLYIDKGRYSKLGLKKFPSLILLPLKIKGSYFEKVNVLLAPLMDKKIIGSENKGCTPG